MKQRVYGYVNGKAVYSRNEFIFAVRGFGPIENDNELLAPGSPHPWEWPACFAYGDQ